MPTLVSVYDLVSDTSNVVRSLKARGFDDLTTYSPAPFDELEEAEDPTPSKVRILTLLGGLAGVVTGFGIQIWMSMDWPIKIAGKNFAAIPPMWIIGFELTILSRHPERSRLIGFLRARPGHWAEATAPRSPRREFGVEREERAAEVGLRGHNAKEVSFASATGRIERRMTPPPHSLTQTGCRGAGLGRVVSADEMAKKRSRLRGQSKHDGRTATTAGPGRLRDVLNAGDPTPAEQEALVRIALRLASLGGSESLDTNCTAITARPGGGDGPISAPNGLIAGSAPDRSGRRWASAPRRVPTATPIGRSAWPSRMPSYPAIPPDAPAGTSSTVSRTGRSGEADRVRCVLRRPNERIRTPFCAPVSHIRPRGHRGPASSPSSAASRA